MPPKTQDIRQPTIPYTALFAFVSGLTLIIVQLAAPSVLGNSRTIRSVLVASAVLMLIWSSKQLLDFVSRKKGASRRITGQRIHLPLEGLIYILILIVILFGSFLGGSNVLLFVFALMTGPLVLSVVSGYAQLRRTNVSRSCPRRMMAGETTTVEIELHNRKRWFSTRLAVVADRISHSVESLQATVLFICVPPKTKQKMYYQLRLMRRGRYRFEPIELSSRFPLGIIERGLVHDVADEIIVHPRIGRLTSRWKNEILSASEAEHRQQTQQGVFDDEFHRIREFRTGDNPRSIHWRTSARRNELMVRDFHQNREQDLVVLLDLWLPNNSTADDRNRVELAVSFAATVCVDHTRKSRDSRLSLHIDGATYEQWSGQSLAGGVQSLLDTFALAQGGRSENTNRLVKESSNVNPSTTTIIMVTTRKKSAQEIDGSSDSTVPTIGVNTPAVVRVFEAEPTHLSSLFRTGKVRSVNPITVFHLSMCGLIIHASVILAFSEGNALPTAVTIPIALIAYFVSGTPPQIAAFIEVGQPTRIACFFGCPL